MEIGIVGDIHGIFYHPQPHEFVGRGLRTYKKILKTARKKNIPTIQIGDLGVHKESDLPVDIMTEQDEWFAGNHDWPTLALNLPHNLGRFGVHPKHGVFFVSGARSTDAVPKALEGHWYANEQLDFIEQELCLELYEKTKPRVLLAHDCPRFMWHHLGLPRNLPIEAWSNNDTSKLLETMLNIHVPELFLCGHHHVAVEFERAGCLFRCVDCLELVTIEV